MNIAFSMGSREGEECSIQMEGYYENILPVAEATGRHQPPEQSSTSGKYLVFIAVHIKKSVIIVLVFFIFTANVSSNIECNACLEHFKGQLLTVGLLRRTYMSKSAHCRWNVTYCFIFKHLVLPTHLHLYICSSIYGLWSVYHLKKSL